MTIESLVTCGIATAVLYRALKWVSDLKSAPPDPWGPELEHIIQDPDLEPLCHRCFTPHSHQTWFCPECGASVGEYNNYMPYVYVFPQGEVLRSGVRDHVRRSPLTLAGYLLMSFSCYTIFAPLYWYFLYRNFWRQTSAPENP